MGISVQTWKVNYALQKRERDIIHIPIEIVMQTSSLVIENYCLKTYPTILQFKSYSLEELYALQKMKAYIKSHIVGADRDGIIDFLYQKQFMGDVTRHANIYTLKVDQADAKMWQSNLPYLSLTCTLSFNIRKYLEWFIQNRGIKVVFKDNAYIKEILEIHFEKPLPFILIAEGGVTSRDMVLQMLIEMCNTKSSLSELIGKELKINNIHTFKKEVRWVDDRRLRIVIDDLFKILGDKIKKNAVPLGMLGLYVHKKREEKKKKVQVLQQSLNIYRTMLAAAEELHKQGKLK